MPPSLPESVSQSLNQRWRERPRCPASRVTPGRRVGVVHAIVGRAACRCVRAQVLQDERAARVFVFVSRFAGMKRRMNRTEIGSRASLRFPGRNLAFADPDLAVAPIADFSLAPCSASSTLFASLRPGASAGPAGVDNACARHVHGPYAMAGILVA